ncbi:hypothetical protein F5876DRAFT_82357 [Lentinula aff. lateritia]|uniref:Uncharacterized protein n=1 Tax=Lentinula aff. lateritia TaxID=2804960 RepID=A0ACC1TK27_9AGAR|nr:hypothetical protein F5876DRAFT_82357 [Lentinula aff. lateritia]
MKFFAVLSAVLVVALGVTSTTAAAAAADIAPDANTMETFFLAPVSMETVGSLALLECGSMKNTLQYSPIRRQFSMANPPKPWLVTSLRFVNPSTTFLGHHLNYDDAYLAHVLERIVELIMLFFGMTSGYGRIKTLTDASVR